MSKLLRVAAAAVVAVAGVGCFPGPLDASTSTVTVSPATAVANGADVVTISVTLRSADGKPISDKTVVLSATGSSNTIVQPSAVTDANGTASGTITSTVAEDKIISATVDGVAIYDSPTATFAPGPAVKLRWAQQPPAQASAGIAMVPAPAAELLDANDNRVSTATDAISVAITSGTGSGSATLMATSPRSAISGVATFDDLSIDKAAGGYTLTATSGALTATVTNPFDVVAGPPSAALSTVTVTTPPPVVANGTATHSVSVHLIDAQGNPVQSATVDLTDSTGTANTLTTATTNSVGDAVLTIATTKAESKTLKVTAARSTSNVLLATQPSVQFVAGPVSASTSLVSPTPTGNVTANGTAYSRVTVTLLDANLNPVAGQTVDLASTTGTGNTFSQPSAVSDSQGQVVIDVMSTVAQTKQVVATVNRSGTAVTIAAQPNVIYVAGPPSAAMSTVSAAGYFSGNTNVQVSDVNGVGPNDYGSVFVQVKDAYGNAVSGVSMDLTQTTGTNNTVTVITGPATDASGTAYFYLYSTKAEVKTVKARMSGTTLINQQPTLTFTPRAASDANCTVVAVPQSGSTVVADGLDYATVTVHARDEFNNDVPGVAVDLTQTTGTNNTVTPASVNTDSAGLASLALKSTKAEVKTVKARLASTTVLTQQPTATFVPGLPDLSTSTVVATPQTGSTVVADNADYATVVVTVKDANLNLIDGASIDLSQTTGTANTSTPGSMPTSAGVATLQLKSTKAESKVVKARINAGSVIAQQPSVLFVAGPPDTASFTVVNADLSGQPKKIPANTGSATVTATITDQYGNGCSNVQFDFSAPGPGNTFAPSASGLSNANGQFTAALTTTVEGVKRVFAAAFSGGLIMTDTVEFWFPVNVNPGMFTFNGDGSCIGVSYSLISTKPGQRLKSDVIVEVDPTGSGTSYQRAFMGQGNDGVYGLLADAVPWIHGFVWDTTRDMPYQRSATTSIRVTPVRHGLVGTPAVLSNVSIDNTARIAAPISVVAPNPARAPVIAYFDGNGGLDTAVITPAGNDITVYLSDASGSPPTLKSVGPLPPGALDLAAADFDRDGDLDLAVSWDDGVLQGGVTLFTNNLNTGANNFAVGATLLTGRQPRSIAAMDVTRDSKPDIVTVNQQSNSATVYRGNGDGTTFAGPFTIAMAGASPVGLALADFDRDGIIDLYALDTVNKRVLGFAGLGTGAFTPSAQPPLSFTPEHVATGDLNKDGRPDLVVSGGAPSSLVTLLGNGIGTFGPERPQPTFRPDALALADMDKDGRLDAVLSVSVPGPQSVFILTGSSSGDFTSPRSFATLNAPTNGMAIGDLDRDGNADVLIAPQGSATLQFHKNITNSRCALLPDLPTQVSAGATSTLHGAVADFDNDGRPDVATANAGNPLMLLRGSNFQFNPPQLIANVGLGTKFLAAADLDGDLYEDIIDVNQGNGTVTVLPGTGNGNFTILPPVAVVTPGALRAPYPADLDNDGDIDFIIATSGSSVVPVINNGGGTFVPAPAFQLFGGSGVVIDDIAIADLNGDDKLDIAVASSNANQIVLAFGDGSGSFSSTLAYPLGAGITTSSVIAADLNEDGFVDLAFTMSGAGSGVLPFLNDTFPFGFHSAATISGGGLFLKALDINQDGHLDLVWGPGSSGSVGWTAGNGNATFGPVTNLGAPATATWFAPADIDGDTRPDLAIIAGTPSIAVAVRNIGGRFSMGERIPSGGGAPVNNLFADFNRDGADDLVALDEFQFQLWPNAGDGSFTAPMSTALTLGSALATADQNRDGIPDLLAGTSVPSNGLSVATGDGTGNFSALVPFSAAGAPVAIAVGDVNRDGISDAVIATPGGAVELFLGNGVGFVTSTPLPGALVRSLVEGDFDRDGDLDLVLGTNSGGGSYVVLQNDGNGGFAVVNNQSTGSAVNALAAADLDRDGILDLAFGTENGQVRTHHGLGNLVFTESVGSPWYSGWKITSVIVVDGSKQGVVSVVAADQGRDSVVVLGNQGNVPLVLQLVTTFFIDRPSVISIGDLNGDGYLDAAVSSSLAHMLTVMRTY